ncbi:uncharacterized protein LOC108485301 [Gossypium arboreum]|uniref:uncharacterized protein LOC108485301 n=1 Tax=Gossypium arboreum TaxID=29729 RepID=UPI0008190E9C|nr:uncharacterized protein LOC108485301 [Gossypium arboreum]
MAEYEAEFLRLSHYARGMMATENERCVRFKDGLRDNLRVLIAPQRERNFFILVEKAKIAEDVKRAGLTVTATGATFRQHWNRCHPGECWRATGACLRCGSTEHRVKDCPLRIRYKLRLMRLHNIDSTHSYIASTVSGTLGIPIENIDSELIVISPLGQLVLVDKLYRDVPLEVQGTVFLADLVELSFGEFNLILVWTVKDIRTVRDFPDVFPEELPGLPPSCEVEFGIELVIGTTSVSITPYRMAPKELTKLKA